MIRTVRLCLAAILLTTVADAKRAWKSIDVTDRPAEDDYERFPNKYLGKYQLGVAWRATPRECGERCDVTTRCVAFNYNKPQRKCSMLTQSKYSVSIPNRFKVNTRYEHFVRINAEYQCPGDAFKHPYKARCYLVINNPMTLSSATKYCIIKHHAQLALIPNSMTRNAIWHEIQQRLSSEDAWIGLMFRRGEAYMKRSGQKSPFLWTENLANGLPSESGLYAGAVVNETGKFDYFNKNTAKSFICEIRPHTDRELNELCPFDTALFDGHCYWSGISTLRHEDADDSCEDRGGALAAFPSAEAIRFAANAWIHIIPDGVEEAWLGLRYMDGNWTWYDNDEDMDPDLWKSSEEHDEGMQEPCGSAVLEQSGLLDWKSRDCDDNQAFLCMGPSGATLTRECSGDNPISCPTHSTCVEGFIRASCQCNPGYNPTVRHGQLQCTDGAVCQASGDPHYSIFDGGKVHYQGRCRHLLAGPCPGEVPNGMLDWKVRVYNDHRVGFKPWVTFTEFVEVDIFGHTIKMGPGNNLMVDHIARIPEVTLTYLEDHFVTVSSLVSPLGMNLATDFGLSVRFKGFSVTVSVPSDYQNIMCGICGNYNGNPSDDMAHDQDKWMVDGDDGNPDCSVDDPYSEPDCDADVREAAEERCGLIHSMSILDICRSSGDISLSAYYTDCVEDSCAGDSDQLCSTMESLKDACDEKGHEISPTYRYDTNCTFDCGENSSYQAEMSLDVATCQNPDAIYDIPSGTGEGCACDEGYIHDAGRCVLEEHCGCLLGEDRYVELGTTVTNSNCTEVFLCKPGGEVETTSISCAENAACTLGDDGDYACVCEEDYVGDPLLECYHEDGCPYPMPDGNPSDGDDQNEITDRFNLMNTNTALKMNLGMPHPVSLLLNEVVIDPNRPTSILHMDPDSWVVNPFCQIVTCYLGENYDVSDPTCVEHASCEAGGPNGYQCVCEHGYTGNGTVECTDDGAGTGDPHFLMTSHSSGQHLCFDAHGYDKDNWLLLKDNQNSLVVTGELFETNSSTKENPQSYFSSITIKAHKTVISFTRTNIAYNGEDVYKWNDKILLEMLMYNRYNLYEVKVTNNVILRVSRSRGEKMGKYLGVHIVNSDGLSEETTGIMGQFIKSTFDVEGITRKNGRTSATLVFNDYHAPVLVTLVQRYNLAHHGLVDCWLYRSTYKDDRLLGPRDQYDVTDQIIA